LHLGTQLEGSRMDQFTDPLHIIGLDIGVDALHKEIKTGRQFFYT
jgi:hypothetical protein